jgi:release factor glutamine methyltransferase
LTTGYPDLFDGIVADSGVYVPQHDSRLLADALRQTRLAVGRRVLDLCTGSGVLAIAAAQIGAASVTAFDICPRAVRCSLGNAHAAGVDVDVRLGSLAPALACGPYDVVVSNPPYVPVGPDAQGELIPAEAGPAWAWNGGDDGRLVLDPLCESAPRLLARGGSLLLVQSEFAGIAESLACLRTGGLDAEILTSQRIPLGPVLSARAQWLQRTGRLRNGHRQEKLVVIKADKP